MIKILNLKLETSLEHQNSIFSKSFIPNWSEVFVIKKVKMNICY